MAVQEDDGLSQSMRLLADAIARLEVRPTVGVEELLTVDDLAVVLKIPARTIKDQLAAGLLPHHRFGKHYRFDADDVKEILRMTAKKPVNGPLRSRSARVA
ncbi:MULTISPECIES: helix-turn-helix domain-containing protein [unclassified Kribbella]|uniref:helix-turn-helix domain-containing protein n=1 Tax=unclassified Kribbella TaxID=2644121 RepID=UPI00307849F0